MFPLTNKTVIAGVVTYHEDFDLWHYFLGHPSSSRLESIKDIHVSKASHNSKPCFICLMAKLHKLPFTHSQHKSIYCFELIHCDLWGPCNEISYDGFRYFLTIVDDFSRCTWVYLLKYKSDASTILQGFYTLIETQFATKIKTIRSDNGGEFDLKQFYHEKCIIHQKTCVETPEQNVIVERKHQHILNVARALRFQSGLAVKYWSDCVLTAVYLINRTPSPILNSKTPFEILFKTKPAYTHLRVFGYLGFAFTFTNNRHKFDTRAKKSVFLGYPFGIKGYKLLDLNSKKVFISRNVVFHENIFLVNK